MVYSYTGHVDSDLNSVKKFIKYSMDQIVDYIPSENKLFDIRLIISELIINGAIHGNKLEKQKNIYLSIYISDNRVSITVRDEGKGLKLALEDYNPDDMEPCGRGLILVNGLVDDMKCVGNTVKVRMFL